MPRPVCLPAEVTRTAWGRGLPRAELSCAGSSAGAALPAPGAVIRGRGAAAALRRGAGPAGGCGG